MEEYDFGVREDEKLADVDPKTTLKSLKS